MLKAYLLLMTVVFLVVVPAISHAQHDFSVLDFNLDSTLESVESKCKRLGYVTINHSSVINNVDGSLNLVIACGHPDLNFISKDEIDYKGQKLRRDSKRLPVIIAAELRYDRISDTHRVVLYNFLYLEPQPFRKALSPVENRKLCSVSNNSSGIVENYKSIMWGIIAESMFDPVMQERRYTIELGRPGHNSSTIGSCKL